MAPKKVKTTVSSGQAAARTRKRRLSAGSNASEQAAGPSDAAKKRKRGKQTTASPEPDLVIEEDAQNQAESLHRKKAKHDSIADASKHVSFEHGAVEDDMATASHRTPHPRKMAVKRRTTMSPSATLTRQLRTSIGRSSLPPGFQQEGIATPTAIIRELQFAPLRQVLQERVQRRLAGEDGHSKRDSRSHAELEHLKAEALDMERRINSLTLKLENANDAKEIKQLEEELEEARAALDAFIDEHDLDHIPDVNMMVLNRQGETQVLAQPSPRILVQDFSEVAKSAHDGKVDAKLAAERLEWATERKQWEAERHRFHDTIMTLNDLAKKSQSTLSILTIELSSLGFGDSEDPTVIVQSIRQSFANVREALMSVLPASLPETASNQDTLEILLANVNEFTNRLRTQEEELITKDETIADLSNQIQGLLDHLADAEIRKDELEKQWRELDEQCDSKARDAEDLEEQIADVEAMCTELKDELRKKIDQINSLTKDHEAALRDIEKLQTGLEHYRKEERRLTDLIHKMEDSHQSLVAQMKHDNQVAVQGLEDKLEAETELRVEAEKLAEERRTTILKLETSLDDTTRERDRLADALALAESERNRFIDKYSESEELVERMQTQINELKASMDGLEDELEETRNELEKLRKLYESEQKQRERAEAELDKSTAELEKANKQAQKLGMEANELRMRIHIQQEHFDAKMDTLETEYNENMDKLKGELDDEKQRVADAEKDAEEGQVIIDDLQAQLVKVEMEMAKTIAERNERIEALLAQLGARKQEIDGLNTDVRGLENELALERTNATKREQEASETIKKLESLIAKHEAAIEEFRKREISTTEIHDAEIDDRNARIAELHEAVDKLEKLRAQLLRQISGLEQRVTNEAETVLELQSRHADETAKLQATINDQHNKILIVEQKAVEADNRWQEVLESKDEELEVARTMGIAHEESITTLTTEMKALVQKFMAYVRQSSETVSRLRGAIADAKAVADSEGGVQIAAGDDFLSELQHLDVDKLVRVTKTTTTKTVTAPAVVKKTRGKKSNKRVLDSGIGMGEPQLA
ncbi:hypothetical protein K470DRAFT_254985 [Piedraia hortae CBS 480.64]|uniref:Uncharacterized protein n=1 Tax=Piedraia hortae CBS 480.64 TaxID=1314780 RepID=A0A6A7C9I4_9PEZI|nr:hypothetical protein K470DRAFT_254985 [Piedraia hortae CBS 480.64]